MAKIKNYTFLIMSPADSYLVLVKNGYSWCRTREDATLFESMSKAQDWIDAQPDWWCLKTQLTIVSAS